ncbi:Lid2 complex component snt2 [Lecanosticta acicola]|uniref:Lid2 complex component snt2 n=1 Tax=Lecanosticta acicola TaxID=111012 RepID=A0AAI8Z3V5_9PEZI|nr:Lid2 complex component snt2 [Lecanosticta acicola]
MPSQQRVSKAGTPAARMSPASSFQPINTSRGSPGNASPAVASQQQTGTPPARVVAHAPQAAPQSSAPATHPSTNTDVAMLDATYGTRSRNRTNTRPNYAEDQDMDFEFSSAATTTSKKKAADAPPPLQTTSLQAVNVAGPSNKESTPTNSGAGTATSKKRKAPAAALQQTAAASSIPPPAAVRKSGASASSAMARETNVMTFSKHRNTLNKKGELVADDGTKLSVNDHVYLVCEPPGDPYYLCRIMEFLRVDSDNPNSPIDSLRVNWYYRPRDVQRFSSDTRLVYGTMHSDMCPITSLRGKCTIKHRSEVEDLEAYRKERDSFYFVQVFDRFIRRSYECIPVQQIVNVPDKVKKALDERWKFVVVEIGRVKELTSAAKSCKRCAKYAASSDSVDCAICKNSYHMNCVQPPLPKKPSRGFAWACGPCSRASEREMEARNTPTRSGDATEAEEEVIEEEQIPTASNDTTRAPSPSGDDMVIDDHPATQAEIALAKMWPMRYLGIHARVEDALQYDDRAIYPRASSRLGPRHQANVNMWHGRPVELVKPAEIKKRYNKGTTGKKENKLTKETLAAMEAEREEKAKRPKWVQDEPPGYVARGEDYPNDDPRCTAKLMFEMPSVEKYPKSVAGDPAKDTPTRQVTFVDQYVHRAKGLARAVGVPPFGTNFLDKALEIFAANKYNPDAALKQLQKIDRRADLHEPVLSKSDLIKFEEGVAKYGSEHRLIRLHMKTNLPHSDIVRFYYLWKKTPKGREIWGNYGGRKKRKVESDAGARLQAEVANDVDDSAFDNDKAVRKNRSFQCKFCSTQYSRQWRRAPGVSPGQTAAADKVASKDQRPLLALCLRCAGLWRKYAIQWEEIDEVAKKISANGGRAWKKKIDEELLRELLAANDPANQPPPEPAMIAGAPDGAEPPKKKSKTDKDGGQAAVAAAKKEKPPPPPKEPTPPPPPIIPAQPTWKVLPCAICKDIGNTISCAHCKLTLHRRCFGVGETDGVRQNGEVHWVCEQCQNDRNPTVSTDYSCCLCLTEETLVDLVEPPKVSHKKKTDREREKERLEKELCDNMRAEYRNKQISLNRPVFPREPLKRTTGNNWVHVYCALWAPEIRFSDAKKLEVAEGFQQIPPSRFEAVCKLCKNKDHRSRLRENAGACVNCFQCQASFHASCAYEAGYTFGFDVQPVKGSRKDQITTATLGQETGALTAVILCKEHNSKSIIHPTNEVIDESGKTSLQVYAENYKQADLTLTGTVRKAAQAQLSKDKAQQPTTSAQNASRRESGAHSIAAAVRRGARNSTAVAESKADPDHGEVSGAPDASQAERRCVKCNIDVTPKWHPVLKDPPDGRPKSPERLDEATDLHRPPGASDTPGAQPPQAKPQNIRFMAPGASGRAWDGMPERYGARNATNGERNPSEPAFGVPVGTPSRDPNMPPPVEANGELQPPMEDGNRRDTDEVYHNHALPRYQNPAARLTPAPPPEPEEPSKEEEPQGFLCHKCFLKKKLDPTPPPEDSTDNLDASPSAQKDGSSQAPTVRTIEQQFEVWDRPPPPPTPVPPPVHQPPMMNGYGPPPHYGPTPGMPPPHQGYAPHPFGPPTNGYHHPPPPLHERHSSYPFPPLASPNPGPHFAPPPPPQSRGPPLNGYGPPPPSQPMANGMPSPHASGPAMQSPTYQHPPQMHGTMPPRSDQPFPGVQLQPLAPPLHSSPSAPFGRPRSEHMNGPTPGLAHQQQQPPPPPQQGHPTQPPTPQPLAGSPQPGQARPGSQPPRPTTPRSGQGNGTPNPNNMAGASASPNLMNLIHQ